jgi:predicted Zn-dependent peptidase
MIEKTVLKNGTVISIERNKGINSVAFGIFVKNGSANEEKQTNGISHFIEHMLFKGTKTKSSEDIARISDEIGGMLNAYTTKEYTCYYMKTLKEDFEKGFELLCDMFFNSVFDYEATEKEKGVVKEEINMYEDSPQDIIFDKIQYDIWKGNPLSYPILGSAENIDGFNREKILSYMEKHYLPQKTVVAVSGNIGEDAEKIISERFEQWKNENKADENQKPKYSKSIVKLEKDIEQIHLCAVFDSISLKNKYNYAVSVINSILGGGMSSRLFRKIRAERGLAYTVYSYNSSYENAGIFNIYAGLNPKNTQEVIEIIKKETSDINISNDLISLTKNQLKANYIISMENNINRMSAIGRGELFLGKAKTEAEVMNELDSVDCDMINQMSEEIFKEENMSIAMAGRIRQNNF